MKENNTYHDGKGGFSLPESLRVNPFIVPQGYFDTLSSNIRSQIRVEKLNIRENKGFSVPEGYFEGLQHSILSEVKLTSYKDKSSFEVPEGYFDALEDSIRSQVKLDTLRETTTFSIPEGYFENLHERIRTKIVESEWKEKVTDSGFAVPDGYFAQLTQEISAKTIKQEATPIRQLNLQKWIQYAAAACVATVLGIGSYNAVVNQTEPTAETQLASIPEEEIIHYLASSTDSDDILYIMEYLYQPQDSEGVGSQIDDEDIEDYLNYML